jgi:hypothetical protein
MHRPGQPEFNRALETSLKDDDTKTINIGLEDHDRYYIILFRKRNKTNGYSK